MKYVRTRYLLGVLLFADLALFGGGVPLLRTSLHAAESRSPDSQGILLLLLANLALLSIAVAGLIAFFELARRGAFLLLRRYAVTYARSNSGRRTNRGR